MPPITPLFDRFLEKLEPSSDFECWEWKGTVNHGYGRIYVNNPPWSSPAHRVSYELLVGPIPEGLHIDHLCRNTLCVNPDHLEPVTPAENTRRGSAARRTDFCKYGHSFEDALINPKGHRSCRTCVNERRRARYRKRVGRPVRPYALG